MAGEVLGLPIEGLRLPVEKLDLLKKLGLGRVEQVETIARSSLASRLGEEILVRLDQAMGRAKELMEPIRSIRSIDRKICLEYPISQRSTVLEMIGRLLTEALGSVPVGHGINQLVITLILSERVEPEVLSLGSCRPIGSTDHWRDLIDLSLERVPLRRPIEEIRLHVPSSLPMEWQEQELFSGRDQGDVGAWELLLDRLSNRLGRERVVGASWVADAQPERSCQWESAISQRKRRTYRVGAGAGGEACRPIRLLGRPLLIEVKVLSANGKPTSIRRLGREEIVRKAWGPERIETGWWRTGEIGRDYYRTELMGGHRLWIYLDHRTKRWFLHGVFD
jgi:protein ImuB